MNALHYIAKTGIKRVITWPALAATKNYGGTKNITAQAISIRKSFQEPQLVVAEKTRWFCLLLVLC